MYRKPKLHRIINVALALTIIIMVVSYTASAQEEPKTGQHAYKFEDANIKDYLLFLPESYNEEPDKVWPMIVYFHGAGTNWAALRTYGMPPKVDREKDFPFIVLSPYYTAGFASPLLNIIWPLTRDEEVNTDNIRLILDTTIEIMDEISSTYRVDKSRIYGTGISQGGYLTFFVAAAYPERFAAIAPIMGGCDPEVGCNLKFVPTWIFHGARDTVIPLKESEQMVKSIEACGGTNVQLTVFANGGHDATVWDGAYNDPKLFPWFMKNLLLDGVHTSVQSRGKLTATWGSLKQH